MDADMNERHPIDVVFSGSRDWDNYQVVRNDVAHVRMMRSLGHANNVHVGDCPTGLDAMVRALCDQFSIPCIVHRADWSRQGKAAGPIRNQRMIDAGPKVGFFYFKGNSRGTKHCHDAAIYAGLTVNVRTD